MDHGPFPCYRQTLELGKLITNHWHSWKLSCITRGKVLPHFEKYTKFASFT